MNALNQTHIYGLLNNPTLGDKILQELSLIQQLPTFGVVAGQAVSSVITEMFGINSINYVINDIDIFIPYHQSFAINDCKGYLS